MLRTVADSLFSTLIEAFPAGRAYTRDALDHASMPAPVAHFIEHAMTHRVGLEAEHLRAARSEWFDYEHPDVRQAYRTLLDAVADHVRVPGSEWKSLLQEATREVVRYLVRPVDTLVTFIFQDEYVPLPAAVIQRRQQYFSPYPYLRDVVDVYFERKDAHELDRRQFTSLLQRVVHQMSKDYTPDQWLRLLEPLFTLMEQVPATPGRSVPASLLRAFFEEKGADAVVRRLQRLQDQDGETMVSEETLHALLASTASVPHAASASAREKPVPPPPDELPSTGARSPAAVAQKKQSGVPLWQQFQQHRTQEPSRPKPPPQPSAAPARPAPSLSKQHEEDESVPLWQRFRPQAAPPDELETLERIVLGGRGAKNRALFVKHLFSSNADEYRRVLRLLQEASSWGAATRVIGKEVFKKHKVNIYSDAAITFTNAVETRFRTS